MDSVHALERAIHALRNQRAASAAKLPTYSRTTAGAHAAERQQQRIDRDDAAIETLEALADMLAEAPARG
jgi:hypothetical protein